MILQTYTPDHPVIQAVQRHDYLAFMQAELQQRQGLHYPPYGQLILLRFSSTDAEVVEATAEELARALQVVQAAHEGFEILGPAPAQVMRVARRFRWQILLKSFQPLPEAILSDLTQLRTLCPPTVSLTLDVDPLNLL
ncbi:hypothetical protein DO97_19980 [Neosynechococcus sphagnicola sy1]|uniref:Primosomal protein N C-terminal domain-containing protein n=1 Tax=Neosynechococcus sphagnicola sy1 TaxID=1497020 RepID=A0A098TND2_9CYAN|nr:hypothetical protein DO97_19980 [Neosynechococcus sphagnicola sy1]